MKNLWPTCSFFRIHWIVLGLLFSLSSFAQEFTWGQSSIDRSHRIFFPKNLSAQMSAGEQFPIFWWNFLVIDAGPTVDEAHLFERAKILCNELKQSPSLRRVICQVDPQDFINLLSDWSQDLPIRESRLSDSNLRQKSGELLAKASLPGGGVLLSLLRLDPLESYLELKRLLETKSSLRLGQKSGFIYDRETRRIVIPLQFAFAASNSPATGSVLTRLTDSCPECVLIGPHSSSFENERRVFKDVEVISIIGTILIILQILAVIVTRRWRLLLLVPPVLVSTFLSAVATVLIFGQIHGLTLSFGTGIIGLALDFGLHSAFNHKFKGNWKANFIGLATTLAGLGVLAASSIPLLRQMMVFSIIGLISGFFIYYIIQKLSRNAIKAEPLALTPRLSPTRFALTALLVLASIVGGLTMRPDLDLARFDFKDQRKFDLTVWLYQHLNMNDALIDVDRAPGALARSHQKREWAGAQGIGLETVAQYIPAPDEQTKNLQTWTSAPLSSVVSRDPFLKPFFERARKLPLTLDVQPTPAYVADLTDGTAWVTLWMPGTEGARAQIKAIFPDALSFREVALTFPRTLARELAWMAPTALLLAFLMLMIYYKSIELTFLSMLPFFCGVGLYFLCVPIFSLPFSFVSLIALVIVFGFSIDYGVFATNLVIDSRLHSVRGVWTLVTLSAFAGVGGFLPLAFCKHPVLNQLGTTLFLGTVGTYLGTLWGIPGYWHYVKRKIA